ncbi:MAG: OmpH family outer membrane protein [Prevotellaceae bacterium]|jgi:outer membrane protein|nr:OmpH family outer membrane protein [Prevotellaceae bacterium]
MIKILTFGKTRLRIFVALLFMFAAFSSQAQKFGYVDSEYILKKIPAYNAAQEQLEKLSKQYQQDIDAKYKIVQDLFAKYQAEKVLLTEEMRQKRENDIITKEKEVKELQKTHFSPEGTLGKKREELLKPLQEKVYNAIKDLANEGGYAIIFDIANNPNVVYNNPRYDLSDKIVEKIGLK